MRRILAVTLLLGGASLSAAAVFALQLGLDHNAAWGTGRVVLLLGGVLLLGMAVVVQYRESLARLAPVDTVSAWRENGAVMFLLDHRIEIFATLCVLLCLVAYAFFLPAGKWTNAPETTRYYDDLGAAFRAGRLDLNIQPSAGLKTLANPYDPSVRNADPALRAFVDTVWDLTYHQGRFYVYWGPAPGLLL